MHLPLSRRLGPPVALLLLALVATPAAAGSGHGRRGFDGPPLGKLLDFHADELGLDETTRQAIREIVASSHERDEELRREIRSERRALHELMEGEPVDREAVMEQVERISELQGEADKHRIDTMLRIREELTPEQRTALVESRERMHQRHLDPVLDACQEDLKAYCPERGPRGFHCLLRHRDELSEDCGAALDALPKPFVEGDRRAGKRGRHRCPDEREPLGPPPDFEDRLE